MSTAQALQLETPGIKLELHEPAIWATRRRCTSAKCRKYEAQLVAANQALLEEVKNLRSQITTT